MAKNKRFIQRSVSLIAVFVLVSMFAGTASFASGDDAADAFGKSGNGELSWWQRTNAYEVYVNSFQDTDGNGYGDINGVTEHLDHFETLGVGAVWLTPVFVSPMKDNGYDVADYYTINPLYGSNEDMDNLLEKAGEKGIRIVMDLVFNHTSDQHDWFRESMKSRDNDYSDW